MKNTVFHCAFKQETKTHDNIIVITGFKGTDGIKAVLLGFSGDEQVIKSTNTRNRDRVCLFKTTENEELVILKTIMRWEKVIIVNFLWMQ